MEQFKLHSKFKPTGDQPQAIEKLARGVLDGMKEQTLMGAPAKPLLWPILLSG